MHASSMIRRSVLKVQITVNITILPGPVSPERRLVATTPNMIATPTDTITANTPAMVDALNISERAKDLSTESSLMTSVLSPRTQTIARNCAAEMTADAVPTAEASTMCAANEPEEKPEATGDDSGAIQGSRVLDDWPFDESSDLMHQLLIVGSKERATQWRPGPRRFFTMMSHWDADRPAGPSRTYAAMPVWRRSLHTPPLPHSRTDVRPQDPRRQSLRGYRDFSPLLAPVRSADPTYASRPSSATRSYLSEPGFNVDQAHRQRNGSGIPRQNSRSGNFWGATQSSVRRRP